MAIGVGTAIAGSAILGGISSALGGRKQSKAAREARREAARLAAQSRADVLPQIQTGQAATDYYRQLLGLGEDTGTGRFGEILRNFDLAQFEESPGYQFRKAEGEKGIGRAQSARGNILSGRAFKEAMRFNQALASDEYAKAYGRNLQNRQFTGQTLMGGANLGLAAAGRASQVAVPMMNLQAGQRNLEAASFASGLAGLANVGTSAIGQSYYSGLLGESKTRQEDAVREALKGGR